MTLLVGSLTRKIVSEMTYNVSSGTLNPTIPGLTYNTRSHDLLSTFRHNLKTKTFLLTANVNTWRMRL